MWSLIIAKLIRCHTLCIHWWRGILYAFIGRGAGTTSTGGNLSTSAVYQLGSTTVPMLKSDKRNCGDFKLTVYQASKSDCICYPIPRMEDLFAKLVGGQVFTKLDMSQAYMQLLLEEESKQYVAINTHRGLFKYHCLPFGILSAYGIFKRTMESLLQGIPNVVVYIDDILVMDVTEQEHLKTLEGSLQRAGLRLKKAKCLWHPPWHPCTVCSKHQPLGSGHPKCFRLQNACCLHLSVGVFWPQEAAFIVTWCFSLWDWSSVHSPDVWWNRDPYCICFTHTHSFQKELLSNWERGLARVYGEKKFYTYLFGHPFVLYMATEVFVWCWEDSSLKSIGQDSEMGTDLGYVWEYTMAFKPTTIHGNAKCIESSSTPRATQGYSFTT